ncbi:unnamed protein product, partial [Lymnaea stagnalis]
MQVLRAILTAGLFIAAQCQLFDRSEFGDGGSFNLTCDVGRIGNVPTSVTKIYFLSIDKAVVASTNVTLIAVYSSVPSEYLERFIPNGRSWVIEAAGGTGADNRATITLTLNVPDAQCSDAGLYKCSAGFHPTDGGTVASCSQNIKFKARIEAPVLTLDHHNGNLPDLSTNTEGEIVKLSCTFEGPVGLGYTWLTLPSGGTNLVPYPVDHNVTTVTPRPTSDTCSRGKYESTLAFKVPAVDTIYICVVKDGDEEASRKNFKIVIKPSNKGTRLGIV